MGRKRKVLTYRGNVRKQKLRKAAYRLKKNENAVDDLLQMLDQGIAAFEEIDNREEQRRVFIGRDQEGNLHDSGQQYQKRRDSHRKTKGAKQLR